MLMKTVNTKYYEVKGIAIGKPKAINDMKQIRFKIKTNNGTIHYFVINSYNTPLQCYKDTFRDYPHIQVNYKTTNVSTNHGYKQTRQVQNIYTISSLANHKTYKQSIDDNIALEKEAWEYDQREDPEDSINEWEPKY